MNDINTRREWGAPFVWCTGESRIIMAIICGNKAFNKRYEQRLPNDWLNYPPSKAMDWICDFREMIAKKHNIESAKIAITFKQSRP